MLIEELIQDLKSNAKNVSFQDVIDTVDSAYTFTETSFMNGDEKNEAGQNNGSCKILFFAHINELSEAQTLQCFGDYYRKDVLENPESSDHQNIRNFIKYGWKGVSFSGVVLSKK